MTRFRFTRLLAAALSLGLVAAACGSSGNETTVDSATTDGTAADSSATGSSDQLALQAPTSDGGTIDLADYAGEDVMLWFWAPW